MTNTDLLLAPGVLGRLVIALAVLAALCARLWLPALRDMGTALDDASAWISSLALRLRDWRSRRDLPAHEVVEGLGALPGPVRPEWTEDSKAHVTRASAKAALRQLQLVHSRRDA